MEAIWEGMIQHPSRFKVTTLPIWKARFYRFLSVTLWGGIPSHWQRSISAWYARLYDQPFSRKMIAPYIRLNYADPGYLQHFKPPHGKDDYGSFQDFFIREFKIKPSNNDDYVWPCEGLLCDMGLVGKMRTSKVKCDSRAIPTIFGKPKGTIPDDYTFTNVFLHNKNYHRIHAPVSGEITRIQHIPGDLVVLRPWIYRQNPSLPAFRNERYNIDITDGMGRIWHLSIVGGPAVRTIELAKEVRLGRHVEKIDQLALFYLGSTCCMAAPEAPRIGKNSFVSVAATY